MKKMIPISLIVNKEAYDLYVPPNRTLLEVLREDLELTGTKESCGEGVCGSCTVLCDGLPIRSCLTLAAEVQGSEISTVEGLRMEDGQLDPLQQSFMDHGAVQCGFCTPGILMSARAFLNQNPEPSETDIRTAISGNICRCTGYTKIVEAIMEVARGGTDT
ncbi:MAG: (2Fe-2S)-binding protein [Deltaproteobacteria bacterium]|nr:MAG: (2Fe-2S)-binding protein [Deltaproteobacteria bacterium]